MCVCIHYLAGNADGLQALAELLPAVAQKQVGKGGFLILRPDSGSSLPLLSVSTSLFACGQSLCIDASMLPSVLVAELFE